MEFGEEENMESCKVVLLGDTGVGKTSIIAQYINQEFSEDQLSTTGATFASKILNIEKYNKTICFEVWDTAGQERFKSLAKMFYKDAAIIILVYDITRVNSFKELEDYWVNQIKEHAPKKVVLAIAGNKFDLYENELIDENKVRKFADKLGAFFTYTSAKNRQGIEELFTEVGNRFCDPNYSYSQEALEDAARLKKIKTTSTKIKKEINEDSSEPGIKTNVYEQPNTVNVSNQSQEQEHKTKKKKKKCC
jgi:small GTP-binding protein